MTYISSVINNIVNLLFKFINFDALPINGNTFLYLGVIFFLHNILNSSKFKSVSFLNIIGCFINILYCNIVYHLNYYYFSEFYGNIIIINNKVK